MGNVALLRPLLGGHLVRLFLAVLAGVSLATSLGLAYPVQRELDAAAYGRASFSTEAQLLVPAAAAARVAAALPGSGCLVVRWVTGVSHGARTAGPVDLLGLAPECDQTRTTFPESTRYAYREVAGDQWLDLTGDAARELGVGPGDLVTVFVGEGRPPLVLTVRGLYATRPAGPFGGRASARALLAAEQGAGMYSTLFSTAAPDVLSSALVSPEVSGLLDAKAPPIVAGRPELGDAAADRSAASLGLVRVIAALAVLGGLAFALRETDVFRRALAAVLAPVHMLGGDAPALLRAWRLIALGTTASAALCGAALGTIPYWLGALAPTFPVGLVGVLVAAVVGPLALHTLLSWPWYARILRQFG